MSTSPNRPTVSPAADRPLHDPLRRRIALVALGAPTFALLPRILHAQTAALALTPECNPNSGATPVMSRIFVVKVK